MKKFKNNWGGGKTSSIDGTGELPSVDTEVSLRLLEYIKNEFGGVKTILDVGAGRGLLQKTFDENSDYDVWSLEGFSEMPFEANRDKWIISDMTIPLTPEYKKYFDLVTSFECIEHIHKDGQEVFWDNIFHSSDRALVGIHVSGGEHENHCFIRNKEWWVNYFESKKIDWVLLGEPANLWSVWPKANCSLFFKLHKK